MRKRTRQVIDAALDLPEFERSTVVERLIAILDGGEEQPVLEAALKLSNAERWKIVEEILASLKDSNVETDLHPSWYPELERRMKSIESGEAKLIPWSEVRVFARELARGDRCLRISPRGNG